MSQSKNDVAWQQLFEKYHIAESIEKEGAYHITSTCINEFREARLMTKFDYKSQLPSIFKTHHLSILPTARGRYVIADFETFQNFEENEVPITKISFPSYLESIDYHHITSESTALNCAYIAGIISDFVGDDSLKPTVNGRMGSSTFDFLIDAKQGPLKITVQNAQLEIDGGYEGKHSLSLIEAKNSISKDFLIRQVFYPYKLWEKKITKPVRPLFLTYTNGVFHFREYVLTDPNHYNSLQLVREKKYLIQEGSITKARIQELLQEAAIVTEPPIPFPQADSFERVINLCEVLQEHGTLSREEITSKYDFDVRQTNYYTDAARYLGLLEKEKKEGQIIYSLSATGKQLFKLSILERQLKFISLLLSHGAFNRTLALYFEKNRLPSKAEVVAIMKTSSLYKVDSESTFARRAFTVKSWVGWIVRQAAMDGGQLRLEI